MSTITPSLNDPNDMKDPLFTVHSGEEHDEKGEDAYRSDDEKLFSPVAFLASKFKAGSMKGSIFTLITATIGTGILLIPNSISESGLAWGLIQMAFCGWLGFYSLMLIIRCAEKAKAYSYQELAEKTFGNGFRQFVNVVFFFANWGTALAYLVLISELVARALGIFFGHDTLPIWMTDIKSPWWPIIIATVFVLPLSLAKELGALRYFCLISFLFIIYLVFVVVFESFDYSDFSQSSKKIETFVLTGTSTTFSTAVFAYLSHPNVLDVFKELHNPIKRRMRKVIIRTTILVFCLYAIVGTFGYITFAENLKVLSDKKCGNGTILFAYGFDRLSGAPGTYPILSVIALLLIGMSVIVATPLCIKPAKDGLNDLFFNKKDATTVQEESPLRHVVLVIITIYTGVIVGILSTSMQDIIKILGSSFFTMIAFIMPSAFYIKLSPNSALWGHKIICWILIFVFSIFTVWSTYDSILSAIEHAKSQ